MIDVAQCSLGLLIGLLLGTYIDMRLKGDPRVTTRITRR